MDSQVPLTELLTNMVTLPLRRRLPWRVVDMQQPGTVAALPPLLVAEIEANPYMSARLRCLHLLRLLRVASGRRVRVVPAHHM